MIRVLLWKEYREQRLVVLALALVAVMVLVGWDRLEPWDVAGSYKRDLLLWSSALFLWIGGAVQGSILLAGEREAQTLGFLDMQPLRRRQLWRVKALFGLALLLGQFGFILALNFSLLGRELLDFFNGSELAAVVLGLFLAAWLGFSWGMLLSANCRSVMTAIVLAIIYSLLSLAPLSALVALGGVTLEMVRHFSGAAMRPGSPWSEWLAGAMVMCMVPAPIFLATAGLLLLPLAGSARLFSSIDRNCRRVATLGVDQIPTGVLLWLSERQVRWPMAAMMLAAVCAGPLVPLAGWLLWPPATLLLGVAAGVLAFADEQTGDARRFLAARRLPAGQVWRVKVGLCLVLALAAALLLRVTGPALILCNVLSDYVSSGSSAFSNAGYSGVGEAMDAFQPFIFYPLWLGYGFCIGHLAGLLCRKTIVAVVVAVLASGSLTALWVPSLVGGGLYFLQVFGVPLILLVTARLLLWPWAGDRLGERRPLAGLCGGVTLAGLWLAGGLWLRVAEFPPMPVPPNLSEVEAELTALKQQPAGALIRQAEQNYRPIFEQLWPEQHEDKGVLPERPDGVMAPPDKIVPPVLPAIADCLEKGWPKDDRQLTAWLKEFIADDWRQPLVEAAGLPLGMVEDLRQEISAVISPYRFYAPMQMSGLLLAGGLQAQSRGDQAAFIDTLRVILAFSRNVRNRSFPGFAMVSAEMEQRCWNGLDRWLEQLAGRPELLRQALAVVQQHLAQPAEPLDAAVTDYLFVLDWCARAPTRFERRYQQSLADLAAFSLQVPWEHERLRRLAWATTEVQGEELHRLVLAHTSRPLYQFINESGHLGLGTSRHAQRNVWSLILARARAAELRLALRLCQAEAGKPAQSLDQLVPRYLAALPVDPFSGTSFHYRLSTGEQISWPGEPPHMHVVAAGQGVLWSVGPDGEDNGGRTQWTGNSYEVARHTGADIIFLVPAQPAAP